MGNLDKIQIKICGLSTTKASEAAIMNGADMIGVIFFPKSPRHLKLEEAQRLSQYIDTRAKLVAVTVNADDAFLDEMVDMVRPDILQLHGSESVERVIELKSRFGLPVFKAFAIKTPEDFDGLEAYAPHVDAFLFDAKAPKGADLPGGNGVSFDWQILENFKIDSPWILSGGLNADNVREAIKISKTFPNFMGIDASSGIEKAPGVKSIEKIEAFLKEAN